MTQSVYPMQEVWIRLEEGRTLYSPEKISTPDQAAALMARELSRYDREVVLIVNLNNANQPINFNMVSMGTLNMSVVDVGNVLKSCLLSNAGSFIMLHNHPSGDVTPSKEDLSATRRMILAGALIGIPCLDHIIVAGNGKETYSMRENKDLEFAPGYEQMMDGAKEMVAESAAPFETPFGEIDPEEFARSQEQAGRGEREEVTLHFGKGLCQFFTSKKGEEMARVKIPNTPYESWPSFVVPARIVHDNRYGKGYWMKLPADAKTTLTISKKVTGEDGLEKWQDKKIAVDNRHLKDLVEAYRKVPQQDEPGGAASPAMRPKDRGR